MDTMFLARFDHKLGVIHHLKMYVERYSKVRENLVFVDIQLNFLGKLSRRGP
jgi:hypothetical protein